MNTLRREGESKALFFLKNCAAASIAASTAEVFTIPIDTAKVRLQILSKSLDPTAVPKYRGFYGTMATIAREEGFRSLYNGLTAGLQRQCVFAGLRIGLYVPVRNMISGELKPGENPSLLTKISAGLATGAIGISVANPTDVVKIRLQAQGRSNDPKAVRYNGTIDCYRKIIAADGVTGLWVGLIPNIMRNSVINAAEIASYDLYKQMFLQYTRLRDNIYLHFVCAFLAGFTATCVGSPFDVVKTRMMNKAVHYNGFIDCVTKTMKAEGPGAFYNGFTANFMRIGTWNIVMFVTLEQIKAIMFPPIGKE